MGGTLGAYSSSGASGGLHSSRWREGERSIIRQLSVFSIIGLSCIAASLAVYPAGGAISAIVASALVLYGFRLSSRLCGDLVIASVGDGSGSCASVEAIEALRDETWKQHDTEARLRELLDAQSDIICRRDGEGRVTFVNRAFCRCFGVEEQDVLATKFRLPHAPGEEQAEEIGSDDREQRVPPGVRGGSQIVCLNTVAGARWFEWERHILSTGTGDAPEIQEVGRDITKYRVYAHKITDARAKADAAAAAKSRFLASVSHEIRTPMNGIMGMTGLLLETEQTPEQINYCQAIDQSARTLLGLIDEILDFSKIEAGKLELRREPFALCDSIQNTVELLAPKAHEKGLEIAWTVDSKLPSLLVGDQVRVRQILLNLLSNALRFTDQGGVLVSLSLITANRDAARVALQVTDTGIGMSPDELDGIFNEFEQAQSQPQQRRGGTGLGLAISRQLALAMGGDIKAVSSKGRGTTFTVELQLDMVEGAQALGSKMVQSETAGHVLLAFDRTIERRALAQSLRSFGITVTEVASPADHAPLHAASDNKKPIDLIIVDADCDPLLAGSCLEEAKRLASGAPVRGIILINALARASLDPFRMQGFDAYLVRPVRPSALLRQLSSEPGAETDGHPGEAHQPDLKSSQDFSGLHVLIAEDNEINALLARTLLEKMGCSFVMAGDGQEAVDAVRRSFEGLGREFDLILMDMQMPKMDGLAATAAIHDLARQLGYAREQIPAVIAITANAFEEDRAAYLDAGLDDYMSKPFERSELEQTLIKWCVERSSNHCRPMSDKASA